MIKKKIAVVSMFGETSEGGVERVVYYLKEILEKDYDVEILSIKRSFWKFNLFFQPVLLAARLGIGKYDIRIAQAWQCWPYPADIVISHGTTKGAIYHGAEKNLLVGGIISEMECIAATKAKKVIAVSENCKEELIDLYGVGSNKIAILNNFVDENIFYPISRDLSLQKKQTVIVFSGRLIHRKGVDRLYRLARYIEDSDKFQLRIATNDRGNVEMFEKLRRTKIEIGLSIKEMNSFYNQGDVLYFPTRYEGFSMATLEALSCGIPVVGADFAIPQEIRQYSFVQVVDTEDLDNVLNSVSMMNERYSKYRDDIHKIIVKDFGREQYETKLLQIVNQCVVEREVQ